MLNILEKIYDKVKGVYGPRHFSALLVLLVIISIVGFIIGFRQMSYIREDPDYCNSCHLMRETFTNWRESTHKVVTCQQCHKLGVIEQNMLLIKQVLYGPKEPASQEHGKKVPWEGCAGCHELSQWQGKDMPERAFGHFRHHFVECFNCHPFEQHDFPPDVSRCGKCHRTKEVHGSGMRGVTCIDCHIFSQRAGTERKRVIPTRQRCKGCHEKALAKAFPESAPMSEMECFECHNPHGAITPDNAVCGRCHDKDVKNSGHAAHKSACTGCHPPHTWKTQDQAALCGSCHPPRTPVGFTANQ